MYALPYCAKEILLCKCSIRTPTAKSLAHICTPRARSISNVSRALCPIASTKTDGVSTSSLPVLISCTTALCNFPFCKRTSFKSVWKRTSPPLARIYSRMFFTMVFKLSLPICGFCNHKISSGAPNCTNVFNTSPFNALCVCVLSFPSEKVPAPPSPNCTLLFLSSTRVWIKLCTLFSRSSTLAPRSITIGVMPRCNRRRAQNSPAGPLPTINARSLGNLCFGKRSNGAAALSIGVSEISTVYT